MFKKMMAKRLPASQTAAGENAVDSNTQISTESVSQSSQAPLSQTSPDARKRIRTEGSGKAIETPPFLKNKVAPTEVKEHKVEVTLKESVPIAGRRRVALPESNATLSTQQVTTTSSSSPIPAKKDLNKSQITRYHLRQMIAWNKTLDGLGDVFQNLIRVLDADPSRFTYYCLLCHQEFSATTSRNAIRFASDHILEQCDKQAIERKNRSEVGENIAELAAKIQELVQKYQKIKKSKTKTASKSRNKKEEALMKGLLHHRNQVLASYIKTFLTEIKLDFMNEKEVSLVKSYLKDVLEQDCAFEEADLADLIARLQRRYRCS